MVEFIDMLARNGLAWLVGTALTVIYLVLVLLGMYLGALVVLYGRDWVKSGLGWLKGRA